jgi:cation diffusion facilitator family transporter
MMRQSKGATKLVWWGIALNIVLAVMKGLSGYFGHSEALLADAVESTSDVFSSSLVLLGLRYTARPADDNHPYGHGRAETLFTFIVVAFLLVSTCVIAYRSVINLYTPHELPEKFTLIILGVTIVSKELFFRITSRAAKHANSQLILSDAWHHRSDAITSLAALAGISIALFLGKGYESADDYAALLACVVIIYNAYKLFRPALGEVMDEQVYQELIDKIRATATKMDGVQGTEKCYVRKSGQTYYVDLHIIMCRRISPFRKGM